MAVQQQPKINGRRYSYASVRSDFGKLDQQGIVEINYSDNLDPGIAKGASPQDMGTTIGDYKAQGSITLLRAEYDRYIAAMAAAGGTNSFMDVSEDVTISYADPLLPTSTDELVAVRIKANDHSNTGPDPTKVKCDMYLAGIIRNGILPFAGFQR